MWKKLALMVMVLALISVFTIPPAEAGSSHRVLKALVLGGLFAAFLPPPPVFVSRAPEPYYDPPPREYVPGRWETTHEWVPGTWERVWIPGHYDHWGRWVAGHYENRQTQGYYADRRVWIEGYHRSY
jgi:hypothetical protein